MQYVSCIWIHNIRPPETGAFYMMETEQELLSLSQLSKTTAMQTVLPPASRKHE